MYTCIDKSRLVMQSWAIGTTSEHLNTYTHKYMCIVMPVKVLEGSCTLEVSNETLCLKGYVCSQGN